MSSFYPHVVGRPSAYLAGSFILDGGNDPSVFSAPIASVARLVDIAARPFFRVTFASDYRFSLVLVDAKPTIPTVFAKGIYATDVFTPDPALPRTIRQQDFAVLNLGDLVTPTYLDTAGIVVSFLAFSDFHKA